MIQLYEKILPGHFCNYLIDKFESEKELDKTHDMFDQLEIVHWEKESTDIIDICKDIAKHYCSIYDKANLLPKKRRIEGIRLKRYTPNVHSFPLHVDVAGIETCTRYLSFLIYLNDNEAGTKFYLSEDEVLTFDAECGNILVFPPMWFLPHEGLKPTVKSKYIASTYFHYV